MYSNFSHLMAVTCGAKTDDSRAHHVMLAITALFAGLALASLLFGRAVARRVAGQLDRKASLIAVGVLVVLFLAALLQYVAIASPIISVATPFDGGFDKVFR